MAILGQTRQRGDGDDYRADYKYTPKTRSEFGRLVASRRYEKEVLQLVHLIVATKEFAREGGDVRWFWADVFPAKP